MEIERGAFFTFEGGEGAGKSTQIKLLADYLSGLNYSVLTLREPGGTPIGEEIRHTLKHSNVNAAMVPETELLLMNASRAQLVREIIRPALQEGKIVLSDRFYDSSMAYQGYGRGLDLNKVKNVIDFSVGDTRPDLTFLININPQQSEENRKLRAASLPFVRDRFEEADRKFFESVYVAFNEIAKSEPYRIKVIPYLHGHLEGMQTQIRDITRTFMQLNTREYSRPK
ncbi:MAG: dTMP kinase [archaeon]